MDAMALTASRGLTEAQHEMLGVLDDIVEHLHTEFDSDDYQGPSTCGMAHIHDLSGNGSFVRRVKSLADSENPHVTERQRRGYVIEVGGVTMTLMPAHDTGYRLSVRTSDLLPGPEQQRLDAQERIHKLALQRIRYNGYADDARVRSRMD
jgi:hypothetical protein